MESGDLEVLLRLVKILENDLIERSYGSQITFDEEETKLVKKAISIKNKYRKP